MALEGGMLVFGNGEKYVPTVGQLMRLREGAAAEVLAPHTAAGALPENRAHTDSRRARRAFIHQRSHGKGGHRLGRIRIERFARILLALQVSDGAMVEEEIGYGDAFALVTVRTIAEVKKQFLRARFFQSLDLAGSL